MTSLAARVDHALDQPTMTDTVAALTRPVADLPGPIGAVIRSGIALEERRAQKDHLTPLIVEAWLAASPAVRERVLNNERPAGLYMRRAVARRALAGEDTRAIPLPRQAIDSPDDPRFPGLVAQVRRALAKLNPGQLGQVFRWGSPNSLRALLADLTAGVPVRRMRDTFATEDAALAWLDSLRADGWVLVEPQITDRARWHRYEGLRFMAGVGVFRPTDEPTADPEV